MRDKPGWPPTDAYESYPLPPLKPAPRLREVNGRPTGSYCNRCGETHITPSDFARCRQANEQREQL